MDADLRDRFLSALSNRYRLDRELGRGGMAVVYLAEDLRHGRRVALKVLRPELTPALGGERFQREIGIAARLQHPHILSLHDSGTAAGLLYYAMPYVEGESLRARLTREVQLDIGEAVRIAGEVAGALAHAHGAGVIHRDIKPENILLSGGHAMVADFGIARALDAAGGASLTETGLSLGTPCYMSPEQGMGGRALDGRSDLYALGCVLYEMLAGEPPFTGPTAQAILARHAVDPVPSLRTLRPTLSAGLERVIVRSLAKVPADRYPSATEFGAALEQALQAPAPIPTISIPAPTGPPKRQRRHVIALIGAVAAIGGVVAGVRAGFPVVPSATPPSTQPIRSLAVAPFTNLTGDSSQIYLTEGITNQLVTTLAQIGELRVIALKHDQAATSPKELADNLGIETLLTGSLQRAGSSVRITIQLRPTTGDAAMWARSYDGELQSILTLEDQVARSVADRIQVTLTPQERARITASRPVVTPAAHEAYVRGTYFLGKVTEGDFRRAIGYFQQAIDIDPTYAGAYYGLSECYGELGYYALGPPNETFPKARAAALKALELDSTLAEAWSSLARVTFLHTWDFAAADREFRRGVALNPKAARIRLNYMFYLSGMGRKAESFAHARLSIELDPLSLLNNAAAARPYYNAREYAEAVAQSQRTLDIDSTFSRAHFWLGMSYEQLGRATDAIRAFERTIALAGRIPVYLGALGHAYAVSGRRAEALSLIEELQRRSRSTYISPVDIATVYVGLGRRDETFAWLEKAYEGRAYGLVLLNVDPRFDGVRSDPRFTDLMRRVGLPPVPPRS
ncbi:MAG TPA: protein kinase [Gemmatimonadales bacterium]|nr:protein kinase [Gemmatimonadales bacterium]